MTKQLKVDSVVNVAGTGKPNFPVSPTSGGAALSALNTHSYTSSATEPSSPKNGAIWWDSANNKVYVYANGEFKEITLNTAYPSSYVNATHFGDRGLRFGGYDTGVDYSNVIDYWDITSAGNATDFGDLTVKRNYVASCSNASRAVSMGGASTQNADGTIYTASGTTIIDYVTIANTGNATDFGDLLFRRNRSACESNGTRAVFGGGTTRQPDDGSGTTSIVNNIEYITIANTGNATDFGDLTVARERLSAASNGTRIVFVGGKDSSDYNTMDYVTGDTTGNATDFGDMTNQVSNLGATGTGTGDRAIIFGGNGSSYTNVIQYFAVSNTGNAADFGDCIGNDSYASACCNSTKAQFVGGYNSAVGDINRIQEVTMATLGNATDFGDITNAVYSSGATSGAAS